MIKCACRSLPLGCTGTLPAIQNLHSQVTVSGRRSYLTDGKMTKKKKLSGATTNLVSSNVA
jgi:hypothetical protein